MVFFLVSACGDSQSPDDIEATAETKTAEERAANEALAAPTTEIPERYTLQQSLDFTITLTTTSVGGTFGRLDRKHSCERGDTSPHIAWEGVPEGAESLALVMEDPMSDVFGFAVDAFVVRGGTPPRPAPTVNANDVGPGKVTGGVLWAHWVVYSIPPDVTELEPGLAAIGLLGDGSKQGTNDYERVQYNGPCPIPSLHSLYKWQRFIAEDRPYYFTLYALDTKVDLPPGADRDSLLEAIDGHILAAGELPVYFKSTKRQSCKTYNLVLCLESIR